MPTKHELYYKSNIYEDESLSGASRFYRYADKKKTVFSIKPAITSLKPCLNYSALRELN